MCAELQIMEGDRIVRWIATTADAVEFFGAEHVRLEDGRDPRSMPGGEGLNWCLCPIDIKGILAAHGYRRIGMDDPRWDPCDMRIEKIAKPTTAIVTRTAGEADNLRRAVRKAGLNLDVRAITACMTGQRYDRVVVTFRIEDAYPLPGEEEGKPGKRLAREKAEQLALDHLRPLLPPGKQPEHMPLSAVFDALPELGA